MVKFSDVDNNNECFLRKNIELLVDLKLLIFKTSKNNFLPYLR